MGTVELFNEVSKGMLPNVRLYGELSFEARKAIPFWGVIGCLGLENPKMLA